MESISKGDSFLNKHVGDTNFISLPCPGSVSIPLSRHIFAIMITFRTAICVSIPVLLLACSKPSGQFEQPVINIGVVVTDLNRSLDFYKNVLGMKETGVINMDAELGEKSGLTGGLPARVKVLKLEDSAQATEWKLMTFEGLPQPTRQQHIQDAAGMRYVSISVRSVAPFLERLRKNNIPLLGQTPVELQKGVYLILFQDPDGIFIELIGNE